MEFLQVCEAIAQPKCNLSTGQRLDCQDFLPLILGLGTKILQFFEAKFYEESGAKI